MRRSSLGKTLAGLTLALFALEAVSQSKDEALTSIGDNNEEPSGWMRLEVAIFVDTSDETVKPQKAVTGVSSCFCSHKDSSNSKTG